MAVRSQPVSHSLYQAAGIEDVEDIIADIENAFDKTEETLHIWTQISTDEKGFLNPALSQISV